MGFKHKYFAAVRAVIVSFASLLVTACLGGGSNSGSNSGSSGGGSTYTVSGTISGLATGKSVVLQVNRGSSLTVNANGTFTFPAQLNNAASYSVSIFTLPAGQTCTSTYGSGTINSANVTNVNILCGPTYLGSFVATGSLINGRYGHTSTLLNNGKVLAVGGISVSASFASPALLLTSAELFDPSTGSWATAASLSTGRLNHTATLLPNGKVLVIGGNDANYPTPASIATAELYDPAANTWTTVAPSPNALSYHTATLLPNGKVLVLGGYAELYDPAYNTWTILAPMLNAHTYHTATLLPSGKVLVAGGIAGSVTNNMPTQTVTATVELYDPTTNTWSSTASLSAARELHSAILLRNGKVLVVGGYTLNNSGASNSVTTAELFDPTTGAWVNVTSPITARINPSLTALTDGKVLLAGGAANTFTQTVTAAAELFDPATNTWATTGSFTTARQQHTATLLSDGTVLFAGGNTATTAGNPLYGVSTTTVEKFN